MEARGTEYIRRRSSTATQPVMTSLRATTPEDNVLPHVHAIAAKVCVGLQGARMQSYHTCAYHTLQAHVGKPCIQSAHAIGTPSPTAQLGHTV